MSKKNYVLRFVVFVLILGLVCAFVTSCKKSEPKDEAVTEKAPEVAEAKTKETAAPVAASADIAPIDLVLPKPMFVGTPQNISVPNQEKPLGKPRPPFYAPVGTKNVALDKYITASEEDPIIGSLEMITDGDKEAADGSYVDLGIQLQQVTVDLGAEYNIYAIVVWHYHKQARVYFDVVVQVSSEPDFLSGFQTVFNNDNDNSAGFGLGKDLHYVETSEGKLIDAKGTTGRYVRFYSNGNNQNEINS